MNNFFFLYRNNLNLQITCIRASRLQEVQITLVVSAGFVRNPWKKGSQHTATYLWSAWPSQVHQRNKPHSRFVMLFHPHLQQSTILVRNVYSTQSLYDWNGKRNLFRNVRVSTLRMYCVDTPALVFMSNGGSSYTELICIRSSPRFACYTLII